MLKAVILLTGPVEQRVLAPILQGHNPRLIVRSVATLAELAALDRNILGCARLGSTAHVMFEKVDAGPIVGVELFGVPPSSTVSDLEELSYAGLVRLFWQLATRLEPLPELSIKWSGEKCTRRRYAEISGCQLRVSHVVRAGLRDGLSGGCRASSVDTEMTGDDGPSLRYPGPRNA
jgi:hypothetical protein